MILVGVVAGQEQQANLVGVSRQGRGQGHLFAVGADAHLTLDRFTVPVRTRPERDPRQTRAVRRERLPPARRGPMPRDEQLPFLFVQQFVNGEHAIAGNTRDLSDEIRSGLAPSAHHFHGGALAPFLELGIDRVLNPPLLEPVQNIVGILSAIRLSQGRHHAGHHDAVDGRRRVGHG